MESEKKSVDCISVNFLLVTLYYRYPRWYPLGNLVGTTLGPFRYDFVQLHVTLQSPPNKKLKKCIGNK